MMRFVFEDNSNIYIDVNNYKELEWQLNEFGNPDYNYEVIIEPVYNELWRAGIIRAVKKEENMKIKVPDNCGECKSKNKIDINKWVCNMPVDGKKEILNISAFEVFLDSRPDWCPINEIVNKIKDLPEEDKILFDKVCDGFAAMFELIEKRKKNENGRC